MTQPPTDAARVTQEDRDIGLCVYRDYLDGKLDDAGGEYEGEECAIHAAARTRQQPEAGREGGAVAWRWQGRDRQTGYWKTNLTNYKPDGDDDEYCKDVQPLYAATRLAVPTVVGREEVADAFLRLCEALGIAATPLAYLEVPALLSHAEAGGVEGWRPQVGERVRVVGRYESDFYGIDLWVAGVEAAAIHGGGYHVTVAEQWPIPWRHSRDYKGQTDGFYVGVDGQDDSLAPLVASPAAVAGGEA